MESLEPREDERTSSTEGLLSAIETDGHILVEDQSRYAELEQAGYGEREGKRYRLKDHEALYLIQTGKMELRRSRDDKVVPFQELAEAAQQRSADSWTRFMIYRDLRSRGYVVKDGFGFGTDLRVYERGDFPDKAAKFVVFALDEGAETTIDQLSESTRQITKMGKEAIVAVIERRGEIIYYKVSRMNFNK